MDGMNRHGLAVSDMSVEVAQPPYDATKPDLIHSAMMRMILDYGRTTDEAVHLLESYNVHFVEIPVHLMVADATGKSCVIEFIDGKMRVTDGANSSQICTNHPVWQNTEAENEAACIRFRTGATALRSLDGRINAADAVEVTRSMAVEGFTMWTSIYDLTDLKARIIYRFQTDTSYDDVIPRGSSGE
jgi:penicillin V acylase-like amidase (Ntn superfamily)